MSTDNNKVEPIDLDAIGLIPGVPRKVTGHSLYVQQKWREGMTIRDALYIRWFSIPEDVRMQYDKRAQSHNIAMDEFNNSHGQPEANYIYC